jgi:lipopolysaccharide biosynthesis regulator YciM
MRQSTSIYPDGHWSKDVIIKQVLETRPIHDVLVVMCDNCNWETYWNQGSHWCCRNCGSWRNDDHLVHDSYSVEDAVDRDMNEDL